MKKVIFNLILFIFFILISFIVILSTLGIETNKFNNLISKKINLVNNSLKLELITVKFKLDIKEISLFLETNNPKIDYKKISIPTKNIKAYIDFISLIKSDPKIKKIYLALNEIQIEKLKKISISSKPSNLTSFINNKIKQGVLKTEIEMYFNKDNLLDNYIARGLVSNLKAEITSDINLNKTSFNFFADNSDVLLKNINSETDIFKLINGDLKLKYSTEIYLESNFDINLKVNKNIQNYIELIKNNKYSKNLTSIEANLRNNLKINFDETYKVKKYEYKNNGKILKATFDFDKKVENYFLSKSIDHFSLIDSEIKTNFNSKENITNISGKYSINKSDPLLFNFENYFDNKLLKTKIKADYKKYLELDIINFIKPKDSIATIFLDFEKKKENIKIKKLNLINNNNSILIEDVIFDKEKFISFKKALVKTSKAGKKNNDFIVTYNKKIIIKGSQFDASKLPKLLNKKSEKNMLSHINEDIVIDFNNIIAPLSENIKNFKLIGKIEKGKFIKITSKGDFGENKFIDITMKKDQNTKKKYLEIYSDLTKPLLTEYKFFKGLSGGKLLFTSLIDEDTSNSKLLIENFNVTNASGMIKLLSLADLSGLADLAAGEGLSFDILEINMKKNKDTLQLNEILALGPSISVLMDGYQNSKVTSLRGTLIPAKTLNKMISKIPLLGNIIIPKEVGEGLFGISFKMKGPPGDIKTTINPIRTITPRFIQKIIDKNKKTK